MSETWFFAVEGDDASISSLKASASPGKHCFDTFHAIFLLRHKDVEFAQRAEGEAVALEGICETSKLHKRTAESCLAHRAEKQPHEAQRVQNQLSAANSGGRRSHERAAGCANTSGTIGTK